MARDYLVNDAIREAVRRGREEVYRPSQKARGGEEEAMTDQELAAIRARAKLARESWPAGSPRPGPMTDRDSLLAHIDAQSAEVARLRELLTEAVYSFTQPTHAGRAGLAANVYVETVDRWRAALAQGVKRGG